MNLKRLITNTIASFAVAVAPALAQSHGTPPAPGGHVLLTPVACNRDGDLFNEGPFTNWVHVPHSHFTGLVVGMTNPDGDNDDNVGARLDGGVLGMPFAPAKTFLITFLPSAIDNGFVASIVNVPGFGNVLIIGQVSIFLNPDQTVSFFGNFNFPKGSKFVGIYLWNFEVNGSFSNEIVFANVDGVEATPNLHAGSPATDGFALDCGGIP